MKRHVRERLTAALVLTCMGIVGCWLLASWQASRGVEPLRLGIADFAAFQPQHPAWSIRRVFAKKTPTEPTIVAYELTPSPDRAQRETGRAWRAPVLVRLVHGYNMVDCMRIKHHRVALLADTRVPGTQPATNAPAPEMPMQVWRVTDPDGVGRVWISSMLRASDFLATTVDTRDMAFPRIGTADDPAYVPTGLTWSSFRYPLRNARRFLRARWNASRTDVLTFLRLRQPAWASEVLLTMVSEYRGKDAQEQTDAYMRAQVKVAHQIVYQSLRQFAASGR